MKTRNDEEIKMKTKSFYRSASIMASLLLALPVLLLAPGPAAATLEVDDADNYRGDERRGEFALRDFGDARDDDRKAPRRFKLTWPPADKPPL